MLSTLEQFKLLLSLTVNRQLWSRRKDAIDALLAVLQFAADQFVKNADSPDAPPLQAILALDDDQAQRQLTALIARMEDAETSSELTVPPAISQALIAWLVSTLQELIIHGRNKD